MRRCPVSSLRLLPWAATLTLSLLAGCGDDFQRVETSAADVATDAAQDANVVDAVADAADGGAQGDTDAVGLPAACTVDGDCAAEAGTCQVASCKEGLCLLSPAADGAACDDGDACTSGEVCKGGQCGGGAPDGSLPGCACQSAADCKDDGDRCTGVPYCDVAAGVCKTNPASVVQCPPSALPCQQVSCVTQSQTDGPPIAACVAGAVAEGTPCDDGNACTGADACKAGACQGGANACQCLSDADCAAFEDGDPCNGTLFRRVPLRLQGESGDGAEHPGRPRSERLHDDRVRSRDGPRDGGDARRR